MTWWYGNNDGVYYQCGEDPTLTWTCQATMGGGTVFGEIPIYYTDYDNYKILYSCKDYIWGLLYYESFSLYGRDPSMSDDAYAKGKAKIAEKLPQYDLDWWGWTLEWVIQGETWCDYESGWLWN